MEKGELSIDGEERADRFTSFVFAMVWLSVFCIFFLWCHVYVWSLCHTHLFLCLIENSQFYLLWADIKVNLWYNKCLYNHVRLKTLIFCNRALQSQYFMLIWFVNSKTIWKTFFS